MALSCPCPLSATSDKSARGSEVQTCLSCRKAEADTRVSVSNGLRLIRIRYGIPYSELPDLKVIELDRYLRFLLLEGQERPCVKFPRRQRPGKADEDGVLPLERLWRRQRWEFAHSVASLKRNLPAGCRRCSPSKLSEWRQTVTRSPPPLPDGYEAFVRREVRRLFRRNWDRNYEDFVNRFVPEASARKPLRSRGDFVLANRGGGKEFRRNTLAGKGFDTGPLTCRYKEVLSAGKVRALTIFDERVDILGPLHKMIYNHLSSFDWLLVGSPTEAKISSVCVHAYQTSVDFVSATDNLSLEVASIILECLLARAERVPGAVKTLACNSLPVVVDTQEGTLEVSNGQMMGGYLSFPLLCIQSYLGARWATRHLDANYLINGDDTLISADEPVRSESYPSGMYVLNDGKTIRAQKVAEINSTCFLQDGKGRWREVRHLRRGSFLPDFPGLLHAAAACRSQVAWSDAFVRSRIGTGWGLSPKQLGLHPKSYPGFQRNSEFRRRRVDTPLPMPASEVDESLRVLYGEPDSEAVFALCEDLRNNGRNTRRKRDVFSPSKGEVRRSFRYLKVGPRSRLTYLSSLRAAGLIKSEKTRSYRVPAWYETREESEGIRELQRWKHWLAESADA